MFCYDFASSTLWFEYRLGFNLFPQHWLHFISIWLGTYSCPVKTFLAKNLIFLGWVPQKSDRNPRLDAWTLNKILFPPKQISFPWPQLWLTCCRGQCQEARYWRREHGGDPPRLPIISYFPAPSYSSSFLYIPPSTPSFSFFQGWQIMETWENSYNIIQPKHPLKNKFIMFLLTTLSGPTKNLGLDDFFWQKYWQNDFLPFYILLKDYFDY